MEPTEEILSFTDGIVAVVQSSTGQRLDLTPETLPFLDYYGQIYRISRDKKFLNDKAGENLSLLLAPMGGAYFGQVLCAKYACRWHAPFQSYGEWRIQFEQCFLYFNPVAVAMEAGFVARSFSGFPDHLSGLIREAIRHPGFSLIDILQNCVSFNRVNTFAWYKKRCTPLPDDYDPFQWERAMSQAREWGDRIPIGVLYRNNRPPFEAHFPVLQKGPLAAQKVDRELLGRIMEAYR